MLDKDQARRVSSLVKNYMGTYQLSSREMQRLSGVDAMLIGAYTHGGVMPTLEDAVALLHGIGMTPSEIDKRLDLDKGTAHDTMVDRWYEGNSKVRRERTF